MKRVFIDVETTGLSDWRNSIHQLAGMIEVDGEIVDQFNYKMRPRTEDSRFDRNGKDSWEKAFSFKNVTIEEVEQYQMSQNEVYLSFVERLTKHIDRFNKEDKAWFIAYNSPFDNGFVRNFFKQNGDNFYGSYFYSPDICVMRMVALECMRERKPLPKSFKLEEVCEYYGLDASALELHDASVDIQLTYEIFKRTEKHAISIGHDQESIR